MALYFGHSRLMPSGSLALGQFPLEMVELAYEKCGQRVRPLKAKLVEAYGGDVPLPDLRTSIAPAIVRTA